GRIEGAGRDEDAFAFGRDSGAFRNFTMLELPNAGPDAGGAADADYAVTILRNFLFASYQVLQWQALARSADAELASIAMKSVKESRYHAHHAAEWTIRLGDGTPESRRRMERALAGLWPYATEFFATDAIDTSVADAGIGVDPATLEAAWRANVLEVLEEATLTPPRPSRFRSTGKFGTHSEHLGFVLAEMQTLHRTYPGGQW
ncbi:MAG: 1,2-phenylacetyl-CoA epoxidase subunit PaaC, partial [Betaproteobacteria bacterium]